MTQIDTLLAVMLMIGTIFICFSLLTKKKYLPTSPSGAVTTSVRASQFTVGVALILIYVNYKLLEVLA